MTQTEFEIAEGILDEINTIESLLKDIRSKELFINEYRIPLTKLAIDIEDILRSRLQTLKDDFANL